MSSQSRWSAKENGPAGSSGGYPATAGSRLGSAPSVDISATFDAYHDQIHRYLVHLTGDSELAADAAQEAFVRLLERPPKRTENLRAWLYKVATNYVFDTLKVARRRAEILDEAGAAGPSGEAVLPPDLSLEREERCEAVRNGLATLRASERAVLLMRAGGFSYREISDALEISFNSVGSVAARALRKLAVVLRRNVHGPDRDGCAG